MKNLFQQPLHLVDVNQLSDTHLKQQQWIGIVARALKHIRKADIGPDLLEWLRDCQALDNHSQQWLDFIRTLLNYTLKAGNVADIETLVAESYRLPQPIGETFMTIAEQLEARGEAKGKAEGLKTTARNLLKEGSDPQFVARVTGLSQDVVEQLHAECSRDS